MRRLWIPLFALLLTLLLAACVPIQPPQAGAAESAPAAATIAASVAPTPAPPPKLPDSCLATYFENERAWMDPALGFCLNYPGEMELEPTADGVALVAPWGLRLAVTAQQIDTEDLAVAADAAAAALGLSDPVEIRLAWKPALQFEERADGRARRLLVGRNEGKLYQLLFEAPAARGSAGAFSELDALVIDWIVESFGLFPPSPAASASVAGRVLWGDQPVEGAIATLRIANWHYYEEVVAHSAVTDAEGAYLFEDVLAGAWELVPLWPVDAGQPTYGQPGVPITLTAGAQVDGIDLQLISMMTNVSPTSEEPIQGDELFTWLPIEGAAHYRVRVSTIPGHEIVRDEVTEEPSIRFDPPLEGGRSYSWDVAAETEDGRPMAYGSLIILVAP